MITLNTKVKDALIKIDFITRYEKLSSYFNADRTPTEDRLFHVDGEEVMEMIRNLGYSPQFDTKEKFYKIEEEKIGEYVFGVHIILWEGIVDLVWVVKENGILLLGGGYPLVRDNKICGGVGVSGGTKEQDMLLAAVASAYFEVRFKGGPKI